jgi:hypothetical protein
MTRSRMAIALSACLTASISAAQETAKESSTNEQHSGPVQVVVLQPAMPSRWDAEGHVAWLGEHRPNASIQWDRWFNMASGGGTVGYYWTSHLKTEFDIATSTEASTYSFEPVVLPGATVPLFLQRDHELRVTTASAGVIGQFFENAWFHPFVGAGVELIRERERIETALPITVPRDPRAPALIPPPQMETRVRYGARPYLDVGFKAYVSERAFIRSDVRTSLSSDGLAALAWHSGVGVDF